MQEAHLKAALTRQGLDVTALSGPHVYPFEPFTTEDYTLTATRDETLTITLSDPEKTLDTWLAVYDADGNQLDENDDANGDTRNSQITGLEVKAGDTITIEASTYYAIDSGDYSLTVEAE